MIFEKLSLTVRSTFKFGQDRQKETPNPIPEGNAAINATVRIGGNSNFFIPKVIHNVNYNQSLQDHHSFQKKISDFFKNSIKIIFLQFCF